MNMAPQIEKAISDVDQLIIGQAQELSDKLKQHRLEMFPPRALKGLREFQLAEVARFLGVTSGYLRNLSLEGKGALPQVTPSGRRSYTAEQMEEMRSFLEHNARAGTHYMRHRQGSEHLQVVAVVNFKGGSGKTTSAAHLAQHLALTGHRVLAVDLDPQASLSAIHGFQPEFDVNENETLYAAIRYDDQRRPLSEIIRPTNFPNLHLVPQDGPQTQMVAFMRSMFKNHVLTNPMLRSVAISDAAMTNQTLYEVERRQFTRATYDRAMEAMDAVNDEIGDLIHKAWGRK
ncbi:AAA family ATPase [Rhizobium hidalgonense]|uniref:AAA family ATPase n=1 Tax=Rhizobium hidalgonense TaxID=1538159 RepID=UPI00287140C5|nr:AAA family ATPase [Rhizobium hidalgonense]MDR9809832.1 AAA family ATPase [Rhizobium hidalgonense]